MAQRRPLRAGLMPADEVDPALEKEFVYGDKTDPTNQSESRTNPPREPKAQNPVSRVPLTTRVQANFAVALKRASLERQLNGVVPNTLQDILEEALEPWLRSHGYIQ
jgi:hypothetical protein